MVVKYLSQGEAFKVAMNLEEEGLKFYEECAQKIKSAEPRHIFLQLAEDEKEHYAIFRKMYDETGEARKEILGDDEEVKKYLASLVKPGVFYDIASIDRETMDSRDEREVVKIAIQTEKDSVLFYTEAWLNSGNTQARKAFKKIFMEERRHLNILIDRLVILGKIKGK